MVTIKSKQCVNSKWIASFLAKENQEHCECGMCKIRVIYKDYEYIVTEQELKKLEDKSRQVDAVVSQQTAGSLPMKFKLYDKDKKHIGNEYHEANGYGVIQIFHESLREDFYEDGKKLVREKYYIPHFYKQLE